MKGKLVQALLGAVLGAVFCFLVYRDSGERTTKTWSAVIKAAPWHVTAQEPPPFDVSLCGLWERQGEAGYYDSYTFVRVGPEVLADAPRGEPAQAVADRLPDAWAVLP